MPETDGWQATREIREEGISTPVVALTARVRAEDQARAAEAGFNGFQTKPLKLAALLAIIEELLSARKAEKQVRPICPTRNV